MTIEIDKVINFKKQIRNWMNDCWNDRYLQDHQRQQHWGKHTKKIFNTIFERLECKWVVPVNRMTQILTNHGYFNYMLNKQRLKEHSYCEDCLLNHLQAIDNADHYILDCPKYNQDRWKINLLLSNKPERFI